MAALRELGVNLAIDDFGTGQSSLQYVQLFPVQAVKLDGSFTARMTHDVQGQAMMGTMILLAHTLELEAVAEGIETAEQLELLKAMRCDFGQGYHLARPMPPDDVTERLADQHGRRRDRIRKAERAV
jgi:EAL domain-containing protein (putative c-di-GMP-specific phosphodiesterase class I)